VEEGRVNSEGNSREKKLKEKRKTRNFAAVTDFWKKHEKRRKRGPWAPRKPLKRRMEISLRKLEERLSTKKRERKE